MNTVLTLLLIANGAIAITSALLGEKISALSHLGIETIIFYLITR